jgi:predicted Zn-dependent protease
MNSELVSLLENNKQISAWKLNEKQTESVELFFIKKDLDMDRAKAVSHSTLTVYVDFEEQGKKYRGSSSSEIHPTMTEEDMERTIERLSFAASFVKNEPYPLASSSEAKTTEKYSNLAEKTLYEWVPEITKAIYEADIHEKGGVNSAELFLNKNTIHIMNSEGVDVSFTSYSGTLEFITTWKESQEEIELYRNLDFASFTPELFKQEVEGMIKQCKDKAVAKPTPSVKDIAVILTGTPVQEFFKYYYNQASVISVYNNISTLKVGDNVQGANVIGDTVNITLDPNLHNSVLSVPYDQDGFPLTKIELYKDGVLERNWGPVRFSHYLKATPTGNIENLSVKGGRKALSELKQESYLELVAFSDFQMDTVTGDFAGEIRLGYYYDGTSVVPVTGGSLSGNIKKVQEQMYLSKELQQDNNFVGPKTILLKGASVAGCDN